MKRISQQNEIVVMVYDILQVVLILQQVDFWTTVFLLSASIILMKNSYLEELHETWIMYFLNTGCYDWIVSMQRP
jgi:hypothetical protein